MDTKELFIKAVQASLDIPEPVRAQVHDVGEVREGPITQSYLDFLDRESRDNPRGPKWSEIMQQRRGHMSAYLDARTGEGIIRLRDSSYVVVVDIKSQAVIHWEEWRHA